MVQKNTTPNDVDVNVQVCHKMWLIDLNPDFPDDTRFIVSLISAILTVFGGVSPMWDKKFMFAIGINQYLLSINVITCIPFVTRTASLKFIQF